MATPPIADTRLSALLSISADTPVKAVDPARASAFASLMRVDGEPEAKATIQGETVATVDSAPVETWPTLAPPQLAATASEPAPAKTDGDTTLTQTAGASRTPPASIEADSTSGIASSGKAAPMEDAASRTVQPEADLPENTQPARAERETPASASSAVAGQSPAPVQSTATASDIPEMVPDPAASRSTDTPDRSILSAARPAEAPNVTTPQTAARAGVPAEAKADAVVAPKSSTPSQPAETATSTPEAPSVSTARTDVPDTRAPVDAAETAAGETRPTARTPAEAPEPTQPLVVHAAEPTSAEIIPIERVLPASARAADLHSLIARSLATDRLGSIPRGVSAGEMKLAATHAASSKPASPAPVTLESLLNREFEIAERLLGEAGDLTRSISERAEGKTGFADLLGAAPAQTLAARGAPAPGTVIAPQTAPIPQPPNMIAAPADIPAVIGRAAGPEGDGADRLVVQLDPPELGRVSIDFRFENNALQGVTVTADTPEALRQLRLMHFDLIQTLESQGHSGLDLSFRQQGGNPSGQAQSYQTLGGNRDASTSENTPTPTPARASRENDPSPGKLDITL